MIISIIAAMDKNRLIGKGGALPWHIPEDLKRFKKITTGHPIIMGRKTFESIGRALPQRKNIIITRDKNFKSPSETIVANSIDEALVSTKDDDEVFIIGGGELFQQILPQVDKMYLTFIEYEFAHNGQNTYFPSIDFNAWDEIKREVVEKNEQNPFKYTFVIYKKRGV